MLSPIPTATCFLGLLALCPQAADSQGISQVPQPGGYGLLECLVKPESNLSSGVEIYPAGDVVSLELTGDYIRVSGTVEDGLYLGYMARERYTKFLRTYKSTDGAASWQRLGDVDSRDNRTGELHNATPLVLPVGFSGTTNNTTRDAPAEGEEQQQPQGRILYAYRNHDKSLDNPFDVPDNYTFYRLTVSASDDGGQSWSFLSKIETLDANRGSAFLNGIWEPFLRIKSDGTTLQVCI